MKRVIVRKPGGPERLEIIDEVDPVPGPGQVRVRTYAAGINYADIIAREGYYEAAKNKYPLTLGFEFSGIVNGIGAGTTLFKEGDRVVGFTIFGGYASEVIVEPGQLRLLPNDWDFPEGAGLPAAHFTAYHALTNVAHVREGEIVLIHSAAGGVGTALLQQAKIAKCVTIGVVGSEAKVPVARNFGADTVLVRGPEFWNQIDAIFPSGIDVSFDANGVSTLTPAFNRLNSGGRLVVYGFAEIMPRGKRPWLPMLAWNYMRVPRFSPLDMTTGSRSVMGFNIVFLAHRKDLITEGFNTIMKWVSEGKIKKPPITTFSVDRIREAHGALESGLTTGKLILTF